MSKLTGNKDADFLILNQLTDYELGKVCQVNKYVNSLCQDENFWMNRILSNYKQLNSKEIVRLKEYLNFDTNKNLYKYLQAFPTKIENFKPMTVGGIKGKVEISKEKVIELLKEEVTIEDILKEVTEKMPEWIDKKYLKFDLRREIPNFLLRMKGQGHEQFIGEMYDYMEERIFRNTPPHWTKSPELKSVII